MAFRAGARVFGIVAIAANLALAMSCNGDEDDECMHCCKCWNDGTNIVYRPEAPGNCMTCTEQCQALADRDFLGQKFDNVDEVSCPD